MGCNLLHSIYVIVTEGAHQFLTMYIIAGVLVLAGLGWMIRRMMRGRRTEKGPEDRSEVRRAPPDGTSE